MKQTKIITLILTLALILTMLTVFTACQTSGERLYTSTYLDVFDTYLTITMRAESLSQAEDFSKRMHAMVQSYHQLFDIYHTYDGMINLKTLNDSAGASVKVNRDMIDILKLGKEIYDISGGLVNIAMGSVLSLWHTALKEGKRPDESALKISAEHCNMRDVIIDQANMTVTLADPQMSIDVGAIAKGYVAHELYKFMVSMGLDHVLVDFGGQVFAVGGMDDDTPWEVGVRDPHTGGVAKILHIYDQVVVTSGADQRKTTIDGNTYHHIISPQTLAPCDIHTSVTLVLPISQLPLSDGLSTALFLCSKEEGERMMLDFGGESLYQ